MKAENLLRCGLALLLIVAGPRLIAQATKKDTIMETFNIEVYKKNSVNGEYDRILKDGTQINQYGNSKKYFENVIPPTGWFYTYKEFFNTGELKTIGELFKKGDFESGIWRTYDSGGRIVEQTNYDEPYQSDIGAILRLVKGRGIDFSLEHPYDLITREVYLEKPSWIVEWQEKDERVERIFIDDISHKIVLREFYLLSND